MGSDTSHGSILRSTSIVGAASLGNIVIGLVRTKALAALLGPSGVGVAGILASIMATASTVAGMGLSGSGVRQLAASQGDPAVLARVRRALWLATLTLGAVGAAAVWLLRDVIAQWAFGTSDRGAEVGWLGLGVFLTVVAGSQTALLQGMRRIGDLARVSVAGAALGAIAGIIAIAVWGDRGLLAFVLLGPAMGAASAIWYARRLPRESEASSLPLRELAGEWRALLGLGAAFMLVALLASVAQLWVRAEVVQGLGLPAAGHFQAAWAISTQYMGFVLAAMVADYYPRLTASVDSPARANQLVNEQVEMGLVLSAPAIVLMMGFAPMLVRTLYSADFSEAVEILRWQVAGDVFKVASWPMGFVLVARGERTAFLATQSLWVTLYVGAVIAGLPRFGLAITGTAFLAAYIAGFALNWLVLSRLCQFRLQRRNLLLVAAVAGTAALVGLASHYSEPLAAVLGAVAGIGFGLFALRIVSAIARPGTRLHRLISRLPRALRARERDTDA